MRTLVFSLLTAVLLVGLLSTMGCIRLEGRTGRETRFYLLSATAEKTESAKIPEMVNESIVGVGPFSLPEYLNRSQIVFRKDSHQVELSSFHHWAEPLEENFARVLASNMGRQISEIQWLLFPWKIESVLDYRIQGEVLHFEGQRNGTVVLEVHWFLMSSDGQVELQNLSRFEVAVEGGEAADVVVAMSQAVADLSRDIARTIAVSLRM